MVHAVQLNKDLKEEKGMMELMKAILLRDQGGKDGKKIDSLSYIIFSKVLVIF